MLKTFLKKAASVAALLLLALGAGLVFAPLILLFLGFYLVAAFIGLGLAVGEIIYDETTDDKRWKLSKKEAE